MSKTRPEYTETKTQAVDALQAVLILTKHLNDLLPFLLALKRVPKELPQRVGLLQETARKIAGSGELAADWYEALELLRGEDLSARSVADLLLLSIEHLSGPALGDVWSAAYQIGLLDDTALAQWVLYDGLSRGE